MNVKNRLLIVLNLLDIIKLEQDVAMFCFL